MAVDARRKALDALALPGAHPGLALDKLLPLHDAQSGGKRELYDALADVSFSETYQRAFARWKTALRKTPGLLSATATTTGPLAVGLGNPSPAEAGLTLSRAHGMPYLPGSALKGLARRTAAAAASFPDVTDAQRRVLFGDTQAASFLVFWDAWIEPEGTGPFRRDTITVHHPAYYNSRGADGFPTDFDDPNPVPFLCVRPGVTFTLAVSGPSPAWSHAALEILKAGLEERGLGAKTNSGYGYFSVAVPERPVSAEESARRLMEAFTARLVAVRGAQDLSRADVLIEEIAARDEPAARAALAGLMRDHLRKIGQWKPDKARCQRIQQLEEEAA